MHWTIAWVQFLLRLGLVLTSKYKVLWDPLMKSTVPELRIVPIILYRPLSLPISGSCILVNTEAEPGSKAVINPLALALSRKMMCSVFQHVLCILKRYQSYKKRQCKLKGWVLIYTKALFCSPLRQWKDGENYKKKERRGAGGRKCILAGCDAALILSFQFTARERPYCKWEPGCKKCKPTFIWKQNDLIQSAQKYVLLLLQQCLGAPVMPRSTLH